MPLCQNTDNEIRAVPKIMGSRERNYWERLVSSVGTEVVGKGVLCHVSLLMSFRVLRTMSIPTQGVSRVLGDPPDPIRESLCPLSLDRKGA